ncbi:MAG: metal-binding protein [Methylococcaceae bacterium]|nr:metal-binding protein [Methylococcaceae bacterium]
MLDRLPEYIDPLHLAEKRGALEGRIPLSKFQRLADSLCNNEGYVEVSLFFGREGKLAKIDGHIKSIIELQCQNCLNAVEWVVDNRVKLGIVTSIDGANRLPEDYDPLLVEADGKVLLKDIIEDELILILPTFPKHQHDCLAEIGIPGKTDLPSDSHSERENPFAILAKLKNTGDL